MLKIVVKATAIIMLFIASLTFAACGNTGEPESTAEPETEAVDEENLYIVKNGETDFWVIRSDLAERDEINCAVGIRKAISEATGAELGITTDWEKNPVYDHEIIVGGTLREKTGYAVDRISLGETGYIIKEVDGKVYISGGSDKGTDFAYEYFLKTFVKSGKDVKIPIGYERIVYHQYEIPQLYIDMNLVDTSYRIIVPENANGNIMNAAAMLKQVLYEKTGLVIEIENGSADTQKAFVISDTVPETAGIHEIHVNGTSLVFESSAKSGVSSCVWKFIQLYLNDKKGCYNFPSDYHYFDLGDNIIIKYPESYAY